MRNILANVPTTILSAFQISFRTKNYGYAYRNREKAEMEK